MSGIAQEREIQFLLALEALQQLHGIGACAQDDNAAFVKFRFCVTELGRFDRSTRSVRFWEDKEDDAFPLVMAQVDFGTFVRVQGEVGGFVADF